MRLSERCDRAAHGSLTSVEWLEFAADPHLRVRKIVAGRADAPLDVLAALASDSGKGVREALVDNPSCPATALARLVTDSATHIRRDAIRHQNTSAQTHGIVARRGSLAARRALAQSEHLDEATSMHLAKDDASQVREELAWWTPHAAVRDHLLRDPHPKVRGRVAHNELATDVQRRILAEDTTSQTRALVACAENSPGDVLLQLAEDRSVNVRFWLTVHVTNRPLMERLAQDRDPDVAHTARSSLREARRVDTD